MEKAAAKLYDYIAARAETASRYDDTFVAVKGGGKGTPTEGLSFRPGTRTVNAIGQGRHLLRRLTNGFKLSSLLISPKDRMDMIMLLCTYNLETPREPSAAFPLRTRTRSPGLLTMRAFCTVLIWSACQTRNSRPRPRPLSLSRHKHCRDRRREKKRFPARGRRGDYRLSEYGRVH